MSETTWLEKWSQLIKYSPIIPDYEIKGFGSHLEPESSIWMASLSESMGEYFKEGLKVLDYGCGSGRYCNFLSMYLKRFIYFGVEVEGSEGNIGMKMGMNSFGHDPRVNFGIIDSDIEKKALSMVDIVLLGSVYTHLLYQDFIKVSDKFLPIVDKGGAVVFSIFIGDEYVFPNKGGVYGIDNCYGVVTYTMEQLAKYCYDREVEIEMMDCFLAQKTHLHKIFKMIKL